MSEESERARRLRERMVARQLRGRGLEDERVLRAMAEVPRHRFVDAADLEEAYDDGPRPIGHLQTISQPYMVALMTSLLELRGGERVLEIGTGSGYQTAVLAHLGARVFTVERIPELQQRARAVLEDLGHRSIRYRTGDGTTGWPEEAPFDRVLVTAGAREVPGSLDGQLADGGILVIPVGPSSWQDLLTIRREGDRRRRREHCRCAFVRLIGEEGWPEEA
jgi:protein-L-isoaspartate(D-aspartate) O-methyltransferase